MTETVKENEIDHSVCLSVFISAAKSQLTTKNQSRVQVLEFRRQIWSDLAWDNREEESYKKINEKTTEQKRWRRMKSQLTTKKQPQSCTTQVSDQRQ